MSDGRDFIIVLLVKEFTDFLQNCYCLFIVITVIFVDLWC